MSGLEIGLILGGATFWITICIIGVAIKSDTEAIRTILERKYGPA